MVLISHSILFLLHGPNYQDTYKNMKYGIKGIWKYVSLIPIKNGNLTTISIMLEDLYLLWVGQSLLHHIYAYTSEAYRTIADLQPSSGSQIWGLNRLSFRHIVTLVFKEKPLQIITCSKRCLIGTVYMVI